MTEWGVVGVIIAVVGLLVTVCTPIVKLNTSITKLTTTLVTLVTRVETMEKNSRDSHQRLWEHNEEQDKQLNDHETRLQIIEKDKKT